MSTRLDEIRAWFEARGIGLVLSETAGAAKAYAHIYGGHPRQLKKIVFGESLLDAAERAKQAVETGGALAVEIPLAGAESVSSATLHIAASEDVTTSEETAQRIVSPPPELIDAHTFILKGQRTEEQGKVWMVQAFDEAGNLLAMGLGDDQEDALLELAEHLLPHEDGPK